MGISGETEIKWLVSCKHFAHSGRAVRDTDEEDVPDRVSKHNCQGFLGFYSTLPAASLSDKLHNIKSLQEQTVYDSGRIERELLLSKQKDRVLASFFPNSFDTYRQKQIESNASIAINDAEASSALTDENLLRIMKTAIILLEVEKIKEEYYGAKWEERE